MSQLPPYGRPQHGGPQHGGHYGRHAYGHPAPAYVGPAGPVPPPLQPPAPRKPRRWPWIVVGVVAFFVIVGSIGDSGRPTRTTTPTPAPYSAGAAAPAAPAVPAEAESAPDGSLPNGIYEVGDEVQPGKYRSTGPDGSNFAGCYIHVKDGPNYLEQNIVSSGQSRITILPGWQGAEVDIRGCEPFVRVEG